MNDRLGRRACLLATAGLLACNTSASVGRAHATLWFCYGGKNREVLLDLVGRFNRNQSKYVIDAVYQGDYFECLAKLRTALAAGLGPTFSHVVGEVLPYLSSTGVLESLDEYPGAHSLGFVRELAQAGAYVGGDKQPLFGIPFNRSTPIMYANEPALQEAGVSIPDTWDELLGAAKKLYRPGNDMRWGFEVPISWWFWVALVGQSGGRVVEPDGTVSLGFDAGVHAVEFLQELVHKHGVMRPPPGRDYNAWDATNLDFLSARAPLTWTSTAFLRYLEQNAKFPVRACKLPRHVRYSVPTGGTLFVMLAHAKRAEKEAAWAFLRWMCETDQTIDWATRTGYLPVTEAAIEKLRKGGYYDKHPNDWVAYAQLKSAEPWPWAPHLFRVQRNIIDPRLEEAVLLNRPARTVLDEARREAKEEG